VHRAAKVATHRAIISLTDVPADSESSTAIEVKVGCKWEDDPQRAETFGEVLGNWNWPQDWKIVVHHRKPSETAHKNMNQYRISG
jgi:hypothetical protein